MIAGTDATNDTPDFLKTLSDIGDEVTSLSFIHAHVLKLKSGLTVRETAAVLSKRPHVLYAEPNFLSVLGGGIVPNDPFFSSNQYGPQNIHADLAWQIWNPQQLVVIAEIDSGVVLNHEDLSEMLYRDAFGSVIGWNYLGPNDGAYTDPSDKFGHGSNVAGIALAHAGNGVGIAGIAGYIPSKGNNFVRLMPIRVLDSNNNAAAGGTLANSNLADALRYAVDQTYAHSGVDAKVVINLSLIHYLSCYSGNTHCDPEQYRSKRHRLRLESRRCHLCVRWKRWAIGSRPSRRLQSCSPSGKC